MAEHLLLVHDVLDAQLVDRRDQKVGRVDELVLRLADGEPPVVAAILIGGEQRARRVGRWAIWLRSFVRRIRGAGEEPETRVSFLDVMHLGHTVKIDVDGDSLPSAQLEVWLRDHIVCRIPGASGESK